ncbi:hypothetical protein JL12_09470 [Gallibacterium anatis 10672-6]|uniref:YadA-like family protein n=1 Tax=Gallibacterium anatis TaxID=750 RepID=UPI0005310ADC|nr:YadA-like family protein [Gallibacterium anatis]KGQ48378.1 hypothetical protein JL12_09470 [Gallibacterium anatis 10672-6]
MNKIYKVIFNRNKNRYEIVSELASSRGGKCKVKVGKQIGKLFMTGLLATFLSSVALAADEEVKVKYDETTGTIKIVKTDPKTSDETILASYAVGGEINPIGQVYNKDLKKQAPPTGIIAIGDQSKAVQSNSIAIGADAHAGDLTPAKGKDYPEDNSNGYIAIGTKTVASGSRSIALGNKSNTNDGSYNIAQGNDAISIGTSTSVFGYSGVSIGRRNIIGIPDPKLVSKDGVLTTKSNTSYKEKDPGGNSVIVGAYNVAYGNRSSIIGTYSRAMGSNSVAIGSGVQSLTDGAIAIGKGSGYEFEDGSRKKGREKEFYGRDWELPPEYKVLKQVLSTDIAGDEQYKGTGRGITWENKGTLPKYNNYGGGSSDPGGFIVEGKNALGIGTYTQVRGDSAIGLATGEMTADLSEKDKSQYARDMRKIMDMEDMLYDANLALNSTPNDSKLKQAKDDAEASLATAKQKFREKYLSKYSFVDGNGALGIGRQILAKGDRSMAVGDFAKAISNDAIAYGGQTLANGTNSMAMGGAAKVGTEKQNYDNSMAIGSHTNVQAGNAVALGAFSQVTGTNSLALGFGTQSSTDSNNITYNSVSGHDSTLIGSYGNIAGNNSILIGSNGNIANDRVVGLGNNINIKAADQNDQENNTAGSVFLGDHAGYVKDSKRSRSLGEVTLVGSEEKKELTESLSSTKGALRDYTEDFIYIYMLENQDDGTKIGAPIAVRSDFAGGDSTVGVVSVGSTYEQKFKDLTAIKDYHTKVGSLITVPVEVEVEVTKNGIKLGKQNQTRYFAADSTEEAINADNTLSETDKKKVWDAIQAKTSSSDSTYTVFETRRIQNVAPGLIGVNSTDAINGSQLFATNQMLGNLVGSLKKTFGDNVTITEDGQIKVSGGTLGWIAKAKAADGSNGTVNYQVGKDDKITKDDLEKKGSAIEAADQLVFQAGKNIGLVQTPDTLTISTIDTPSFKSVELRGDEKTVDGKKVTEVTKIDSSGMKVVTETSTPASDGSTTPTVTEKVSTTVGKDGVSTDGSVKVTNGKDGEDLVTIGKNVDPNAPEGKDGENGVIGLDGKNGSSATITVDRGTSSLDDTKNIGTDPNQDISENNPAKMDRITYTTKNKDGKDVTHEVATLDDGFFLTTSTDVAKGKAAAGVKLNHTIKFTDGANTKVSTVDSKDGIHELHVDVTGLPMTYTVSQTGGTDAPVSVSKVGDTYQLADGTKLVKVDDKFYKPSQLVDPDADKPQVKPEEVAKNWTVNDSISLVNKDGSNNAPTTLKNVGSGLKDANGNDTTLDKAVGSNAVNVDDLRTMGKAATTEVTGTGAAEVTKVTGANGQNIYNVHVDKLMTVKPVDPKANITRGGDGKYYNADNIAGKTFVSDGNGGGSWYNASDVDAKTGKPLKDKSPLAEQPIALDQSKLKNSVVNPNGDGATIVDNVKSGIGGEVKDTSGKNTFIKKLEKVGGTGEGAIDKTTVVNAGDLKNLADTPLFFQGDVSSATGTNNTFSRKLSEKVSIVGEVKDGLEREDATAEEKAEAIRAKLSDGNIGVVSNGTDTLTIKLAKELQNLTSVTTGSGDNTTVMNQDGVTITTQTPKNGDKPASTTETKLSKDGLATDGTVKVTNGKTGDDAKDLVTIGKGTETDQNATDKEFGTVTIDGKNGSNATLTVDRGTKSVTDSANVGKDPTNPIDKDNPVAGMDRLTYTTTGPNNETINHEVATLDDGFFLTTEHTEANKTRTVLFNNTIKVLDGANTKVSAMGGKDGTHTFSIDVTGLPVTYTATKTDANGTPTGEPVDVSKVGDGYQLADGTKLVKAGDNKYYTHDQLDNGQPKPDAEGLTIKESVSLTQDNSAPATLERVGSGRRDGMKADADPMAWDKILNPSAADKAKVDNMLTNAANIGDVRDAIKSITDGTSDNASGGFGLTGNNGDVKQDLGKTITVKGGIANKVDEAGQDLHVPEKSTTDKNTYVNVKNNEMVVEIAKDLIDLDSVTVGNVDENGNGGTVINKDGMTVKDATGNNSTSIGTGTIGTSKTDGNGNTSSTNIDGGTITSEKKDKDGNKQSTTIDGSHMTLENKDKDGKLTGPKTEVSNKGITITPVDEDGKPIEGKKVELSDKGLDNGGNQIKHVDSGLKDEDGKSVKLKDATSDMLNNAVNVGDLKQAINSVTNSSNGGGFGLTGNNGKIMQNLGETITIKGGIANKKGDSGKDLPAKSTTAQNTYVNVKDSEMVVEIAKDLTDLDSVTIGNVDEKGNGGTVINKDSMTVKDKDGKNSTNIGTGTIGTSKTDGNGNTSSTNIDGGTITSEKKDKDGNKQSTTIDGSHMTLENKDKDGKLTGPKTEVSNKGITITPVDEDGKPIEGKKVELSDKGLDNGGNQIKHVDSGLKKENGDSVELEDATGDMLNNAVNVGDLKSVNKKLKDDIINISNQVDDIKNSAPVVYTDENGKRVSKQGDIFVDEDGNPVEPHKIKLSLVNADGKSTTNPSTLQNVAKGVNKTDAVNVEQLKDATEKPLTFNGDAGSSSAKLGETVAIKGGANSADLTDNNIGVIADSTTKTLNVKLSKKLKGLESAEFVDNNGNTTNITGDGVHISGGNGSNVSLTSQGLNNGGNRITNVAPGVEATDAVNVSQLNQVGAALHNRINNVAKGAYGGVASAGAMASLPQAYLPGKSMVAAGASHYRGESAVALGASRISDNGKIILKLNASHNTSGNTMVGAGVGYQF